MPARNARHDFPKAVPVDRAFADRVLRTATGQPYVWSPNRSELQVIGSYTRACRRIIDPRDATSAARTAVLKQAVEHANPGALAKLLWPVTPKERKMARMTDYDAIDKG